MRPSRVLPIASLLAVLSGATAPDPGALVARAPAPDAGPPGAELISERQLRDHLAFIASDLLEGRETPSRGLDIAAAYLASHLGRLGLRPAGADGSFLQPIALTRRRLDPAGTTLVVGTRTLPFGEQFLVGDTPGRVEGAVVYVGNGTVIRSRGVDPYRGLDVTGKIVVSNTGLPSGFSQQDLKGPRGGDWDVTEDAARARGAVAVLFLPDYATLANWTANREIRVARNSLTVDAFGEPAAPALPTATLGVAAIGALFRGAPVGPQEIFQRAVRREPAAPFALPPGTVVRLTIAAKEEHLTTSNVVAVLDGSDPVLAREYVALGAHYDHLGRAKTPNDDGDAIYNGADDDGSGTVGVLAMAEAFATTRPRPRRSMLFVWHTGEEQGLWGSRYFTEHPTVPLDRVVAHLNIDMIGRGRQAGQPSTDGPLPLTDMDSLYVVGSRRRSHDFAAVVERVNARYLGLRYDYSLDAPGDPEQIYERSDHYQYARRGIPIAFFFTGLHQDYHGLDDEVDRIDFPKMRRVVQTIYAVARELANDKRK